MTRLFLKVTSKIFLKTYLIPKESLKHYSCNYVEVEKIILLFVPFSYQEVTYLSKLQLSTILSSSSQQTKTYLCRLILGRRSSHVNWIKCLNVSYFWCGWSFMHSRFRGAKFHANLLY